MVATVLYEKNGVITEERFQKMSVAQWIFHYIEIMKGKKDDVNISSDLLKLNLKTISEDLDLLGIVINKESGLSMIEAKTKIRQEQQKEKENIESVENSEEPKLMTEDMELMEFFDSVPETMAPSKRLTNTGKFFLPTVDVREKMSLGFETETKNEEIEGFEIIESSEKAEKPGLGF